MNKKIKFLISLVTILSLLSLTFTTAFASTESTINSVDKMPPKGNYLITLNQDCKDYLKALTSSGVSAEISTDTNGLIVLNQTDEYLKSTYNLDDNFLSKLKASIVDLNNRKQNPVSYEQNTNNQGNVVPGTIKPCITVKDWKLYFTLDEVAMYFSAAAAIGPEALMLAVDGVLTMLGGPAGAVASVILDIVGIASITNLCYLIIQSAYYGKGIYIGIDWNGPFPNYTQGMW